MKHGKPSMKFFSRAISAIFLSILFSLVFLTGTAQADRSFDMQQVDVNGKLLQDASMKVTEKYTIDFSGQWNGFFVKIPIGDTPIKDVVVSENGRPYTFNPGDDYGPSGTYLVKEEGDNLLIDWSIDALDEARTFTVSYRVIDAVKIHKDTAEFYRKFIGEASQQPIQQVNVKLKLPPGGEKYEEGKDIRIWGHGPLNGSVEFTGPGEVSWKVTRLSPETFVEGRVVMPTALFPEAPQSAYTGNTALPGILEKEEDWAQAANRKRQSAKAETAGAVALPVGAIVAAFLLWRRYGRRHPVSFQGEYYRELPAPYSPGELSVLWNNRKVEARDLTATILDLARRKFLRIDEETTEKKKLFGRKEETAYRLTFLDPPDPASLRNPEDAVLRAHEKELFDFLADTVAKGKGALYLKDLEEFARDSGENFYEFWQWWTEGLSVRGDELNFFDSNGGIIIKTVLSGIAVFVLAVFLIMTGRPVLGAGAVIAGIILVIVPLFFKRRSASGQEDYEKWKAFRRFLLDFSRMDKYDIPSLVIWEHYLVYAVTLGVAKEVIKQLELVFPDMRDGDYVFGYGWYYYGAYPNFAAFNHSIDGISNSFEHAVQTVLEAASQASSGSGGGGGFSGGGGGGGGGGSFGGR